MVTEINNRIRKEAIKYMFELLDDYETAVFPPVVTIYNHTTKDGNLSFQFTLEGLNVCEEEVGIWVTYSKDGTEEGRVHTQLDYLHYACFEEDFTGARKHCAIVIARWLKANVNA